MTPAERETALGDVRVAEGLRLTAYQDSVGVWTIGYGTNLQTLTIPQSLADQWLRERWDDAEQECLTAFPWFARLTGARQRAMVELVYNLGLTRMRQFRNFLAAMGGQDYAMARTELLDSKWAGQVGPTRAGRIAGLIFQG